MGEEVGRFAPSITGAAHPGTLLAALLCWLDARSRSARLLLRLEDLDTTRLKPGQLAGMCEALDWLGLDWDLRQTQSDLGEQHEAALDQLGEAGLLYPCVCSRKDWRERGKPAPDGGIAYDNQCRGRPLPVGGWRGCSDSLRVQLPATRVHLLDESGEDLSQTPALQMGDPVVRRRDGIVAYNLAVVVDDAASAVTRVIRGRDLASSTATHYLLQDLLEAAHPSYRHHFLLMEDNKSKLAKVRGSIPFEVLKKRYSGQAFCGVLANAAGLRQSAEPCTPHELLEDFAWPKVQTLDKPWLEPEA